MLIKWEGGNPPQGGFPNALSLAAILVNIFAVVVSGIPSSIPTPVTVLANTIGMPTTAASSHTTLATGRRVPKQVGLSVGATIATPTDHESSGTHHHHGHGFMDHHGHHHHHHHGHHGDGKYFQYAHVPGYDEYEYGYRRGNDYHFQERYEKYGPYWNFKTKVKWGDKYGGYGEHYWDYNHAGSGGHDDGGHGHGHHSEPVPTYENQPTGGNNNKHVAILHKRQSDGSKKEKRSKAGSKRISNNNGGTASSNNKDAEMNMSTVQVYPAMGDSKTDESRDIPMLVLDRKTGQIIDTQTGQAYLLKPNNQRSYY